VLRAWGKIFELVERYRRVVWAELDIKLAAVPVEGVRPNFVLYYPSEEGRKEKI